jgi:hypothetical protein
MATINEAYATLRALPAPAAPPSPPPAPPPPAAPETFRTPEPIWAEPRRRRRRWPYVLLALAVLGASLGVVAAATAKDTPKGVSTTWGVGSCVQGSEDLTAVRCDGPHDGKITDVESDPKACPGTTDGVVADRGYIWCIDTDR